MSDDTEPRKPPKRNPPPGKQKITREKYDELTEAFRQHGENYAAVSSACKVHRTTAKRAWLEGWANQKSKPWALPIRDVLKREQVEARAALAREKKDLVQDRRIARQESLRDAIEAGFADLVDSRAKQGKVIRAARDNSIAALIVSQKLLKAALPLADKIVQDLDDDNLDVFQKMRLMRQLGRFTHDSIEMAQVVEEMERRALGEPDTILEVQGGVTMTVDEARATLKEVGEVLQMYEEGADTDDLIDAEWTERDQLAVPTGKGETEPDEDADAPEETDGVD